jgi:hypothetical protein
MIKLNTVLDASQFRACRMARLACECEACEACIGDGYVMGFTG